MESTAPAPTPPTPAAPLGTAFSAGSVIARTFSIWWSNQLAFVGVAFLVSLPVMALAFAGVGQTNPAAQTLLNLLDMVLAFIITGALTAGVLQAMRGERLGIGTMLGIGLRKAWPLFLVSFLFGIVVGCGVVLLVVPGLIALAGCYVAVPVLVAENSGITAALKRSWELTRGRRWKVLAVVLVFQLGAVGIVLGTTAMVAGSMTEPVTGVAFVIVKLVSVLVASIGNAAPVVAYHDLRIDKEGASTEQLAAVFE